MFVFGVLHTIEAAIAHPKPSSFHDVSSIEIGQPMLLPMVDEFESTWTKQDNSDTCFGTFPSSEERTSTFVSDFLKKNPEGLTGIPSQKDLLSASIFPFHFHW